MFAREIGARTVLYLDVRIIPMLAIRRVTYLPNRRTLDALSSLSHFLPEDTPEIVCQFSLPVYRNAWLVAKEDNTRMYSTIGEYDYQSTVLETERNLP